MVSDTKTFIEKASRGYQGDDRMLIEVPWTKRANIKTPTDILFKQNRIENCEKALEILQNPSKKFSLENIRQT